GQAVWKFAIVEIGAVQLQPARQYRLRERAPDTGVRLDLTGRQNVRIEVLQQRKVGLTRYLEIERIALPGRECAGQGDVRLAADEVGARDADHVVLHRDHDRFGVLQRQRCTI